jgi:uncharacterized protein YraI
MRRIWIVRSIAMVVWALALVAGLSMQARISAAPLPQTAATPRPTVYPAGTAGTVLAARLNVRAGPSASQRQIGVVPRGTRVEVLQRQGGWLQIVHPSGPGGKGWVSASYVAVDGEPTPVARTTASTPTPNLTGAAQRVAAPRTISYREPTFSWEWTGLNQMGATPWYFDIQVFSRSGADPYHIIAALPAQARFENGVWTFDYLYAARCDSYWTVQIAKGTPDNYQGWISAKSNRQTIGEACPLPTPDCLDCGGS